MVLMSLKSNLFTYFRKVKIAQKWRNFQVLRFFDRKLPKKRLFDQFSALSFPLPQ